MTEDYAVELFRAGLLCVGGHLPSWAQAVTGRPVANGLNDSLLKRLSGAWIDDMLGSLTGTPRSLLLIGGSGND